MSATNDLLDGVARMLQTAGVGNYTPPYATTDTGIYFSLMPAGSEAIPPGTDRCIVLTAYALTDSAANPWTQWRLQVRTRGSSDPFDVNTLSDQVYALLEAAGPVTFGTASVSQILRVSSIPMGQDTNRRWEQSQNFLVDGTVPSTIARP